MFSLTPACDCPSPLQSFLNIYDLYVQPIKLLNTESLCSSEERSALCMMSWCAGIQFLDQGWPLVLLNRHQNQRDYLLNEDL